MTERLVTEQRNTRTVDIDTVGTLNILLMLNDEDATVPASVRAILPELALVVDAAAQRFQAGGSIFYFGAGASGRIGALDAAELPPTFSVPQERVVARVAGGTDAFMRAREDLEDDRELGARDAHDVSAADIVFGLTASGRTPYVLGALGRARLAGALCVGVSSNDSPELRALCDQYLLVQTGPEPVTGSTRMKAATAQKLILNSFSTALMVRLGMTYSNLMVEVAQSNDKLRGRAIQLLVDATGRPEQECRRHLEASGGRVKVALLTLLGASDAAGAAMALEQARGRVREAIAQLDGASPSGD